MTKIDSKVVFITTSPRTPHKMIPEITLLNEYFGNKKWDKTAQVGFMQLLRDEDFFNGCATKDPAFSARDRINRAPQALGFVVLKPTIRLTEQGLKLTTKRRVDEIFLRQLLKFQIPSPYHIPTERAAAFSVKPYLEIFRLIRHLGSLSFDELKMFALQLTDYHRFPEIIAKIERFRCLKTENKGNYKQFVTDYFVKELEDIYAEEIASNHISTRESRVVSIDKFLSTKASNMRDYADACIRYLRATGMVNVSHIGKTLSIVGEKKKDVDFFLENTPREPYLYDSLENYVNYLGSSTLPKLLTDNHANLVDKLRKYFPRIKVDENAAVENLKQLYADLLEDRKKVVLENEIENLKAFKQYDDIQEKFKQITKGQLYDAPLMFEWNVWRAMTMLDGGRIKANLSFDDFGKPLSVAKGNMSDIICDYGEFRLSVEVTLASGQRQYETEGEPVSRHLGRLKKADNRPVYCLFIAPKINEACIAHFFMLHKMNVSYYGGRSTIVPLSLNVFQGMLEKSIQANYIPEPKQVRQLFEYSKSVAEQCDNEQEWYRQIQAEALNWLQ